MIVCSRPTTSNRPAVCGVMEQRASHRGFGDSDLLTFPKTEPVDGQTLTCLHTVVDIIQMERAQEGTPVDLCVGGRWRLE